MKYIDDVVGQNKQNKKQEPFFVYYAMQTPHWPLEMPPKIYTECQAANMNRDRQLFCNSLMYADEMIGDILINLKKKDLYDNTVVFFLSDNGPNTNWGNKGFGQTLPLRG